MRLSRALFAAACALAISAAPAFADEPISFMDNITLDTGQIVLGKQFAGPSHPVPFYCVVFSGSVCGGGGAGASYTAAASPFSVSAGVNKPAGIDAANSAQFFVPVVPGSTTTIDLSGPSGIKGVNGSGIATAANPVPTAPYANGSTTPIVQATASAAVSTTAAGGPTQLIAASGSTKIYVTHYDLVFSGAGTFAWITGTGTNCGTGTTYLTGASGHPMALPANGGVAPGGGLGPILITGAGGELCYITTGAVDISGSVAYAQF